jgi:hypothetical protein
MNKSEQFYHYWKIKKNLKEFQNLREYIIKKSHNLGRPGRPTPTRGCAARGSGRPRWHIGFAGRNGCQIGISSRFMVDMAHVPLCLCV